MRPRIVLTGWLPGAVLLSRGIVPFAVLLQERCAGLAVALMRSPLLSQQRLRVCGAAAFSCGGCVMLRERSLDVKLWRLVSRRNSGLQWRGGIEFARASVFTLAFHRLRD